MSSMPAAAPSVLNYWPNARCAKAFWSQNELPPYRRLLADTAAWLDPSAGERWLDLGCGCGQLTRTLWEKSAGSLAEIIALDCAAANGDAIAKLCRHLHPAPAPGHIRFVQADFSAGLAACTDGSIDGVTSGLAIQYAESFSTQRGCWTREAYDRLLDDIFRVLRPGGRFVFSANVPEPAWAKIALYGIPGFFFSRKPLRFFRNSVRMLRYGAWLKQEARLGRFHYLPADVIADKLTNAGFIAIRSRLSFARQAYVFRAWKPVDVESVLEPCWAGASV
jgi:ubiquinone/menaquinone biosynthesis C-methylase UbiE